MQRSLRGAAADTVYSTETDALLDNVIKKFTIIYESVKSLHLLMRDFYSVDEERRVH